nr:hypothetical protein [Victivallis vadensis]
MRGVIESGLAMALVTASTLWLTASMLTKRVCFSKSPVISAASSICAVVGSEVTLSQSTYLIWCFSRAETT